MKYCVNCQKEVHEVFFGNDKVRRWRCIECDALYTEVTAITKEMKDLADISGDF